MQLKSNKQKFKNPNPDSYISFSFPCAAGRMSKPPRDLVQRAVEIRNWAVPHLSTEATQYEEKCYGWKWSSVNYSPFKILLSSNSAEEKKGTAEHRKAEQTLSF